jgi:hypothetical protein
MIFRKGDIYKNSHSEVLVYITEVIDNKYKLEWTNTDGTKVEKWCIHEFLSMSVNKDFMKLVS